jgi:5-methylcytosine-specific restriction endonuclease McrA
MDKVELRVGYGRCKQCGSTYRIEVDHKRYRDEQGSILGREDVKKDLQLLCARCHGKKR